ncbi:MAG: alanine--tRNA ligase, partial [Verrucomicrobiae bacterium]|nr:alanine--tRNA ligase [Verrucomicrobiae bacterium]
GDTGPCGPCSEIHIDLTSDGDTRGRLVNQGTPHCIEIWNLVFIQFNASPDGSLSPLPAKHVDTGMGFERVTGIIQCTNNFSDFSRIVSNYETDIFRPLFRRLEQISGLSYGSSLPTPGSPPASERERIDVAFRVIADHIRTLAFAIADGILPGNSDRHYVLRRILRRAVRYGRSLNCHEPFLYKLVDVLAHTMGDVFPEVRTKKDFISEIVRTEEEAFNKTLDRGIELFTQQTEELLGSSRAGHHTKPILPGELVFKLYDTYGFPVDLTELMARERGIGVDLDGFNRLMEEQRAKARRSRKKEVIELSQIQTDLETRFVGYDQLETQARVLDVVAIKNRSAVIVDVTPCYAEMGGQVGDTGQLAHGNTLWRVVDTQKVGNAWLHFIGNVSSAGEETELPEIESEVCVTVDVARRRAIQRHHTATHLLHWALREVVGPEVAQKGSFVGPEKLTFDFNSSPLTPQQVADIERLVNERILDNAPVFWTEVKYDHVAHRRDIRQIFGEKYGQWVRVVQIGGTPSGLDGYSMELCGGTHCHAVGEIGLFNIVSESAIAAGVRRIEAVTGLAAYQRARHLLQTLNAVAARINSPIPELERRLENLLEQQRALEKQLRSLAQKQAAEMARTLVATRTTTVNGIPTIIANAGQADIDTLQGIVNELKGMFKGVVVLGGVANNSVGLVASVSSEFTPRVHAGKLLQQIAPIVGGRGGGKADNARGGGKDMGQLDAALARARALLE